METIKPGGARNDGGAAPRKYPDELLERAIRLVHDAKAEPSSSGKNVCKRIGEQLGINPETLRGWVNQAEIDAGTPAGASTDTVDRLAELAPGIHGAPVIVVSGCRNKKRCP